MNDTTRTIDALNQLLAIVYRSFPMYLADASPWTHEGDEPATETLKNIVLDQQASAQRIVELILQFGGRFDLHEYPMEYTDTHFLSLDFLLKELVRYQRRDIAAIERIVAALAGHHESRELAEETL
ncbi:MAG TPA: hypothetical protein VGX78_09450, partial [Pirellulales bacterium]|nr:hypothetical protein [Pirellulales bacterium]